MSDDAAKADVTIPHDKWRAIGILLVTLSALAVVMIAAVFVYDGWNLVAIVPQAILALFALQGLSVWLDARRQA